MMKIKIPKNVIQSLDHPGFIKNYPPINQDLTKPVPMILNIGIQLMLEPTKPIIGSYP